MILQVFLPSGPCLNITDELLSRRRVSRNSHSVLNCRMRFQDRLYLPKFYPVSSDLDLKVGTAQIIEAAVMSEHNEIPSPIHSRPGSC